MNQNPFVSVLTTIQPPTASVRALCRALRPHGAPLIVLGDKKGPHTYPLRGTELLTIEHQLALPLRMPRLLPVHHYVRKNIGYLVGISRGAQCIYETDDDNRPSSGWNLRTQHFTAPRVSAPRWFNVFRHFSGELIWPRGFPLREIVASNASPQKVRSKAGPVHSPIQQGMVDLHPDVDAIWRLVMDRPLHFDKAKSVALMPGVWCPFNSQTAWWFPPAYALMYLPSCCPFRMTDIWRSFVAQRCLWAMESVVTFHAAEVVQRRNAHNLLRDFEDEVPGYLDNEKICHTLEDLTLAPGPEAVGENLLRCYHALVELGTFPKKELRIVKAWLKDLETIRRGLVV